MAVNDCYPIYQDPFPTHPSTSKNNVYLTSITTSEPYFTSHATFMPAILSSSSSHHGPSQTKKLRPSTPTQPNATPPSPLTHRKQTATLSPTIKATQHSRVGHSPAHNASNLRNPIARKAPKVTPKRTTTDHLLSCGK